MTSPVPPTPTLSERPASPKAVISAPAVQTVPLPVPENPSTEPELEREPDAVDEKPQVVIPSPEKNKDSSSIAQEERRKKRPTSNSGKYAKILDIDPSLLEGRTGEIDSVLDDFGWGEGEKNKKSFADMQLDIKRELAQLETGNWSGTFEQNDERVAVVRNGIDKALAEVDELDGLLTLYNVELEVNTFPLNFSITMLRMDRRFPKMLHISKPSLKVYRCRPPTKGYCTVNCNTCWKRYPFQLRS